MSSVAARKQRTLNFRKRKAGIESVESKKPKLNISRQQRAKTGKEETELSTENFVPENIHRMVNYARKGESNKRLGKTVLDAAQRVTKHCDLPKNFSFGSATYGPLSGLTHEERLVTCFLSGKIQPRKSYKLSANMKKTAATLEECGYSEAESAKAAWLSEANLNAANELLSS